MQLTIGILISNRIETVKKCLASIKPLLDEGIAELICVDTVSDTPGMISDGSAELAKKYTDKVFVFPWIKDFSAARNITIEKAEGEWYVFCDDDEWFEDVSEIVRFFKSGEYRKFNSASYIIRNYKDFEGTEYSDARLVRFVKRTEDLHFEGVVHESYNRISLPCKEFSAFAHHYGYAYRTEEEKIGHRDRNISLLKEELTRRPDDLRLHTQMALELATFDNEGALKFVGDTLEKFTEQSQEPCFQWMVSLKFPLLEALSVDPTEAEKEFGSVSGKYHLSETALLSIHYELTRIHLISEDREGAKPHVTEYFRLLDILFNDREKALLQNAADFEKYMSTAVIDEMKGYRDYCMNENAEMSTEEKLARLNDMPLSDFMINMDGYICNSPSCFEDTFLNTALEFFEGKSQIEYCFILYRMAEEEIKKAVVNGANGSAISELLTECICTERRMYELLYKPEVFTEKGLKWVPVEVRYNDILYRFLQGGCKDLKLCLEAAKIRNDMANVMKTWLGAFVK